MSWVVLVIPSAVLWILVVQTGLLFLCVIGYLLRHLQTLSVRAKQRYLLIRAYNQAIVDLKKASLKDEDEESHLCDEP